MIRLVGLSATLPNYTDVASFLHVSPGRGLFHFGAEYRPVPLATQFIGVTETHFAARMALLNNLAYMKVNLPELLFISTSSVYRPNHYGALPFLRNRF